MLVLGVLPVLHKLRGNIVYSQIRELVACQMFSCVIVKILFDTASVNVMVIKLIFPSRFVATTLFATDIGTQYFGFHNFCLSSCLVHGQSLWM